MNFPNATGKERRKKKYYIFTSKVKFTIFSLNISLSVHVPHGHLVPHRDERSMAHMYAMPSPYGPPPPTTTETFILHII